MKNTTSLKKRELRQIVRDIRRAAFRDDDGWNRDKELGSDFIGEVVEILGRYDLTPNDKPDPIARVETGFPAKGG